MFTISDRTRLLLKNRVFIQESLRQGKSPQAVLGVTQEEMAIFYRYARALFTGAEYDKAVDAFLFLSTLDEGCQEYWIGLGMALQMQKKYEAAIDAYEVGATCGIESPVPYFYLAKCFFALHDKTNAMDSLEIAIEYAGDLEEYRELKEQAESAREILLEDSGESDTLST